MKRTLLIFAVAIIAYPYTAGYISLTLACKRDGGMHIFEQVRASGYLNDNDFSICLDCIEDLGAERFSFVDHFVDNAFTNPLAPESGFNRYAIEPIESASCDAWRDSSRWMRDGRRYGIDDNECVALEPIEVPSNYSLKRSESKHLSMLGVVLSIVDHEIADTEKNALLGRHRTYKYTPIFQNILGQAGSPFWRCDNATRPFLASELRKEVFLE